MDKGQRTCSDNRHRRIGRIRKIKNEIDMVAIYLDNVAESPGEAALADRQARSLWDRRRYFYHEGQLTDREKRQAKNAVDQMLEADVFKTTILVLCPIIKHAQLSPESGSVS